MPTICRTAISDVRGKEGKLYYRVYSIEDLVELSFEEVAYLVLFEKLPNLKELLNFRDDMMHLLESETQFTLSPSMVEGHTVSETLEEVLRKTAKRERAAGFPKSKKDTILQLLLLFPQTVAHYANIQQHLPLRYWHRHYTYAENFLWMIRGEGYTEKQAKAFEKALILHIEHSFNASTCAVRETMSTGADIYTALRTGLCALSGPWHGGACEKVIDMIAPFAQNEDFYAPVKTMVETKLQRGEKIYGVGHRVYKTLDPRAKILGDLLKQLELTSKVLAAGNETFIRWQVLDLIRRIMQEKKGVYPNLDLYSGLIYESLGIPKNLYVGLFATARLSGWLAHAYEQEATGQLIRPPEDEVEYIGSLPVGKPVPAMSKRS